nr:MAG TPA: hypothetical protein [Caudoviricetes sp.]
MFVRSVFTKTKYVQLNNKYLLYFLPRNRIQVKEPKNPIRPKALRFWAFFLPYCIEMVIL